MPSPTSSVTASVATLQPDESTTGKHVPALDGIRGLAILLVFACHFLWSGNETSNPILWVGAQIKQIGWVGVDLFFVLSGFLITGILYDTVNAKRFFRNFYARRILRIFPLYYGFIALVSVVLLVIGGRWDGWELTKLMLYIENLAFPVFRNVPMTNVPWIMFNHFWSLAIEEQFYLFWPLLIFLLRTKKRIALAAVVGMLLSLSVRLVLSKTQIPVVNPYILYSWTPSHLDGLFMGALLSIAVRSSWREIVLRWSRPVLAVGAVAILVMIWRCPGLDFQRYWAVAIWGIPLLAITFAALLAATLRADSWLNRAFSLRFMRFFGKYSYGLYVFHYTIAALCLQLRAPVDARLHYRIFGVVIPALVGLAITIVVAMLSFHFFESRFLGLKRYFEDHTRSPKLDEFVPARTP